MDPITAVLQNITDISEAKSEFGSKVTTANQRAQAVADRKKEIITLQKEIITLQTHLKEDEKKLKDANKKVELASRKRTAVRTRIEAKGGNIFARTVADVDLIAEEVNNYGLDCYVLASNQVVFESAVAAGLRCKLFGAD